MVCVVDPNKICFASKDKQKVQIFLDSDGCIADWMNATASLCGVDIKDKEIRARLKKGEYFDELGIISAEDMWKKINEKNSDWWVDLEVLPWAKKLVSALSQEGNLCILTSPGKDPKTASIAAAGKVLWLDKHFKGIPSGIMYNKECCASPNSMLIDDSEKKVKAFAKAGGETYLFPNQYLFEDGEKDIDSEIDNIVTLIQNIK